MHNTITKYNFYILGSIFVIFTLCIYIMFGWFHTCLLRLAIIFLIVISYSISPIVIALYNF